MLAHQNTNSLRCMINELRLVVGRLQKLGLLGLSETKLDRNTDDNESITVVCTGCGAE